MQGLPELLAAIAGKLERDNGIAADDAQCMVVVAAGGNMAFLNALWAVTDPGDGIALCSLSKAYGFAS